MTEPPMDPMGLPIFQFTQEGSTFSGIELNSLFELSHGSNYDIDLEVVGDYVRAELDSGDNVPRIPAMSLGTGVLFNGPNWHGAARLRWYDDQDDFSSSETATEGFTMVNVDVGYRFTKGSLVHNLMLRVNNLTDEDARLHTSRLKDIVPLPGRDVRVSYRVVF